MPLLKQNLNKKCFKWIFRVCQKRKLRLCWVCKLQRDNDWRRVISSSVLVSIFASLHVRLHRSHHLANFLAGGFIDNLVSLCQASRLIQVGRHYVKIPSWLSHSCSSWTAVLVPLTVKTISLCQEKNITANSHESRAMKKSRRPWICPSGIVGEDASFHEGYHNWIEVCRFVYLSGWWAAQLVFARWDTACSALSSLACSSYCHIHTSRSHLSTSEICKDRLNSLPQRSKLKRATFTCSKARWHHCPVFQMELGSLHCHFLEMSSLVTVVEQSISQAYTVSYI